jgi:GT2 family glycosyltransferase
MIESTLPTVHVQAVLYNLPLANIGRTLEYLDNACRVAMNAGSLRAVTVAYGDCSPQKTIGDDDLAQLRSAFNYLSRIDYTYFGANLGSAAGHNRLLKSAAGDFVMILNPDVLAAPNLIIEMLAAASAPDVGFVEARQLPIEHPKDYDPATGETSWASTACAMAPVRVFRALDGFDAETFFLYCDDVDFSWRVRLQGLKVVHRPSAVVFHDKRVGQKGQWVAGEAERYYSAEAGLLLPYKYSRPDLTEEYLNHFRHSAEAFLQRAAGEFEHRRNTGRLPAQIDPDHRVGQFIEGGYAAHRYKVR